MFKKISKSERALNNIIKQTDKIMAENYAMMDELQYYIDNGSDEIIKDSMKSTKNNMLKQNWEILKTKLKARRLIDEMRVSKNVPILESFLNVKF